MKPLFILLFALSIVSCNKKTYKPDENINIQPELPDDTFDLYKYVTDETIVLGQDSIVNDTIYLYDSLSNIENYKQKEYVVTHDDTVTSFIVAKLFNDGIVEITLRYNAWTYGMDVRQNYYTNYSEIYIYTYNIDTIITKYIYHDVVINDGFTVTYDESGQEISTIHSTEYE